MVHILVVAEDAEILSAVRHTLQMDEGINVLAVGDSQAALRLLTEVQPDLILLDREMTFREGLHLPARMRQISCAPILFFTRSYQTQIPTKNSVGGNGLISRIQKALARARIQITSLNVIL